jgi:hypothetical protein
VTVAQGVMTVFPSVCASGFSVGTSASLMTVIGGTTIAPVTTRSASRSNASLDMPTRKLTPATPRDASASVSAKYRVVRAVPPARTSAASVANPLASLARSTRTWRDLRTPSARFDP